MTLTRGFIRNAATTPLDARLMDMAGLVCNADGSPRPGVLGSANLSIVTALATMNVAVAAAEFVTSKGKADGVAIFTNDGVVNVAIAAAPASNSRIDVIWVRHQDNTTGDAASTPIFGVTAGVAAASPTKPAIPTGALELATLRVYAGTTAANGGSNTLVNTYAMTAARGGVVPFRTKADLDLWTTPVPQQEALVLADAVPANNGFYVYVAGYGWAPRFAVYTEFQRADGSDAAFATADTGLVSGTLVNAPPGKYRIETFLGLYGSPSATGSAFIRVNSVTKLREYRTDLTNGSPHSVYASTVYDHPGGNLVIEGGYNRVSGTAVVTSSSAGGRTTVAATYLGR